MKKFSKFSRKIALGIILALVFTSLMPFYTNLDFASAEIQEDRSEGAIKPLATSSDTFLVLEIVPDKALACFGFLVGGQEPMNLEDLAKGTEVSAQGDAGALISNLNTICFDLITEVSATAKTGFRKSTLGTQKFPSGYYKKVTKGEGEFVRAGNSFVRSAKEGEYVWVTAENVNNIPVNDYSAEKVWRTNETVDQINYQKDTLINKELFKTISLDDVNAKVEVKTITPKELTREDISNADLVYISRNTSYSNDTILELWKYYGVNKDNINHDSNQNFSTSDDFTWDESLELFKRVAGLSGKTLPLVWDASAVTSTTYSTNLQKLFAMTKIMNPKVFYNLYLNDESSSGGTPISTVIQLTGEKAGFFKYESVLRKDWERNYFRQDTSLLDSYGILNNDSTENTTVVDNVYTFNGNNPFFRQFTNLNAGDDGMPKSINSKKFFEDILGKYKDKFETNDKESTSAAYVLKYIIGFVTDPVNEKTKIRILDLEPCNDFSKVYQSEAIAPIKYFRNMMPTYVGTIEVVTQTTATFNGKIEDLNKEYDMVYLGLNVGNKTFNLDKGIPVYNDGDLTGKIYLHVGDQIQAYSEKVVDDGTDFGAGWLPGVSPISKGIIPLRLPGNDITKLKKADLEDFLRAGYPIVAANDLYSLNETKIDSSSNIAKLISGFKADKKKTNFLKESLVNDTTDNASNEMALHISVVKPSIVITATPKLYDGDPTKVLADSDDLYIPAASDDYHYLTFEFEIKDNATGSSPTYRAEIYVDRNADGRFDPNKERIRKYENLSVGSYTRSIQLHETYLGAIPWKIAIYNEAKDKIRTEQIGISAVRKSTDQKENIRVLQIINSKNNLNLVNDDRFIKYTTGLNDYNLNIDVMTKEDVEKAFKATPFDSDSATTKEETDLFYKDYDMLIFGFQDMYETLSDDYGAIKNVKYFMDQGKSVLFTHDVTSFNNNATTANKYGYTFNKFFRGYLSMDRFGARIKTEDDLKFTSMSAARDTATKPGTGTYSSTHGYSVSALFRIGNLLKGNNSKTIYNGVDYSDSNGLTTKVSRINEGQLTSYPYKIDETFTCSATHAQYFQLDMEDKDVTVWYTLEQDGGSDSRIYGKSPLDASNNYYIYNKGNITYSGVGHSSINNNTEAMLFVNTMIAAYKAGAKPPTIDILNQEAVPAKDGYILYLNEEHKPTNYTTENLVIEFKPFENSLLSENMGSNVKFSDLEGADATDLALMNPIISSKGGGAVALNFIDADGKNIQSVKSGNVYTINYPLRLLNGTHTRKIVISAENEDHKIGFTTVTIIRRSLFDLD